MSSTRVSHVQTVRPSVPKKVLRVCVNKVCKKQGSEEVLRFAKDLGAPSMEVESCGCLGECGNGPNMVFVPDGPIVRHVATVADMAELIRRECRIDISSDMLRAVEMRQLGNSLARSGDLRGAEEKYTEAINLGVTETCYLLYSNRSGVRLSLDDKEGCLEDALLAVKHAPATFTTAYIRLIDAYYALEDFASAKEALTDLISSYPPFRRTKDFKLISEQLERDLRAGP